MDVHVESSIAIQGGTMQYAEVERLRSSYRLMKLGSCEFDFSVLEAIAGIGTEEHVETLKEALFDVFRDTTSTQLKVVFHPKDCFSFFTPLRLDMTESERRQRLQDEATLLTSIDRTIPLHLTADSVFTESVGEGADLEWFHVLGVRNQIYKAFEMILEQLPFKRHRYNLSTQSAARLLEVVHARQAGRRSMESPFGLAIGLFDHHIEYTLSRHHKWYHSHYVEADPSSDNAYFALALLKRLRIPHTSVGSIHAYGTKMSRGMLSLLQDVLGCSSSDLNPLEVLDIDARKLDASFNAIPYATCIGVTL